MFASRHVKNKVRFNIFQNNILGASNFATFPDKVKVAICGGGAVGNSVAYHLIQNNVKDVVVLEQEQIGCGVSWRGCGIVGHFHPTSTAKIHGYSASLYLELQKQGHNLGWVTCGAVDLARTKDRMIALKRLATEAKVLGLQCEVLGPSKISRIHPFVLTEDLQGGVWIPSDGTVDPLAVCQVLGQLAQDGGALYWEKCKVHYLEALPSRNIRIHTSQGPLEAECVVLCTGMWSRQLGLASKPKFRVPVHAALHAHVLTEPIPGVTEDTPIMRDYDGRIFSRHYEGGMLVGGFEKVSKPVLPEDIPEPFVFKKFPPDWNQFQGLYTEGKHRHPILQNIGIRELVNGPDTFTPDGHWILGRTPEMDHLFVGVGMLGNSVQSAGGIGHLLANWIIQGHTETFTLPFDIKRFTDLHNNHHFLRERIKEAVGFRFAIPHPFQFECHTARKLRCSPLYPLHDSAGAVFGERMGFERPLYFDPTLPREQRLFPPRPTFHKPVWFDRVHEEYLACRERVGVIDMSSFSKFIIKSPGQREAMEFLQHLCSNDVDIQVGTIVSTGMQNLEGGYLNDCLLLRQSHNCYFMMSPTSQITRLSEWMSRFVDDFNGAVSVSDVTSMYTVLNVVGPKSRELLRELTRNPSMNIPFFTCQEMNVGYSGNVLVMGYNNTGEPGYSLYIPSEYALHLYSCLMSVGRDYGIRNVGYYALRFLRIEKFIPFWGEELDRTVTPFEVGRGLKVKLQKPDFLGKQALLEQMDKGVRRRLVHFQLEGHQADTDLWPWGSEPILRNGVPVGAVTSSGYGFTLGRVVCLGFVRHPDNMPITPDFITDRAANYEIDIAGQRFRARASLHPPNIPVVAMGGANTRYVPKPRIKLNP